jgi:hypothetical protein
MKRFWQLLLVGYAAFAVPAPVLAQNLGLNFGATDPDAATASLNPNEFAGVVSQANWNNLELNNGSSGPLVLDTDGVSSPSTASVTWASNNTWRSTANNGFPAGPNRKLTTGYLDTLDTAAGAAMVTVSGIDAAILPSYDVYVYFVSDNAEARRGGAYTITPQGGAPIVKYGSTMPNPTMHVEDPGTDLDNTLDGTYLKFTGLTAPSFTLSADASLTMPPGFTNGFRAPVNAIQIVKPTLPGDVNRDGQVNLTDFHIIRGNLFKTGQSRAQGDLVGDGIVNFADYREWKNNVPPGLAASADLSGAIPEPGAALMLTVFGSLVALLSQRGQRKSLRSSH